MPIDYCSLLLTFTNQPGSTPKWSSEERSRNVQTDGTGGSMTKDKNPRVARAEIEPIREKQMAGFLTPSNGSSL